MNLSQSAEFKFSFPLLLGVSPGEIYKISSNISFLIYKIILALNSWIIVKATWQNIWDD